uniref:Uncharacterized protein n=1 Tax=Oryza nivara TaxID=4536 RepID=A0A0E0G132_ORYNI
MGPNWNDFLACDGPQTPKRYIWRYKRASLETRNRVEASPDPEIDVVSKGGSNYGLEKKQDKAGRGLDD